MRFASNPASYSATSTDSQNVLTSARLRDLTSNLASIQQERIARQTKWDAVNEMLKKGTPDQIPEINENGVLRTLEGQLGDAEKKYNTLAAKLTLENPKLVQPKKDIEDLQAQIQRERTNIIQRIRNDYEQALG